MTGGEFDLAEAERLIPKHQPQRQDSEADQLITVMSLAIRAGCYDAAKVISKLMVQRGFRP